jgi:chromosomal replication initiator protein
MEANTGEVRAEPAEMGAILRCLQDRVGPQRYNAWFKHGTRIGVVDGHIKVHVTNPFVANWIEAHFRGDIVAAVVECTGRACPVVVTIDPSLAHEVRREDLDTQAEIVSRATQGRTWRRHHPPQAPLRHTIEGFVVGQSNKLAYSTALAVAGAKSPPFNPLFVHGPCGVGKTHLLQGICNAVSKVTRQGRPLTWRYLTAEQFTNEFIVALRGKKIAQFRQRYRQVDLLAIDDVHFLAAKKATQDEFLHTFNAVEGAGRQIVMASDAHPRLVGDLNEQLVSRFVAGMVVKIGVPDKAMRLELVRRKAKAMNLRAHRDVLEYIASHARGSVRELEGTVVKLAALSALESAPVTLETATKALSDHLTQTDSVVTLGDIEAASAAWFGITPADIHSSRRTRTVSAARRVAMYLARRQTSMSYPEIGRHMGKNHSSVIGAVRWMESLLAADGEIEWMSPAGGKRIKADKLVELLTEQFT